MQAKAEVQGDGPDMSRPTATAADFRAFARGG